MRFSSARGASRAPNQDIRRPVSWLYLLPKCPSRRVDWRWRLASLVVEGVRTVRELERDPWVRMAARWIPRRSRTHRRRVPAFFEWLELAHAIRYAIHPAARHELEARLLARQTNAEIAQRMDLAPEIVEAYEKAFYNVRPKLNCISYLLREAIGPQIWTGIAPSDYATLWKLTAVQSGPFALEAIMDLQLAEQPPRNLAELTKHFADQAEASLARKCWIAAKTLSQKPEHQAQILHLWLLHEFLERRYGGLAAVLARRAPPESVSVAPLTLPSDLFEAPPDAESPASQPHIPCASTA